jgi:hypothetical protein
MKRAKAVGRCMANKLTDIRLYIYITFLSFRGEEGETVLQEERGTRQADDDECENLGRRNITILAHKVRSRY